MASLVNPGIIPNLQVGGVTFTDLTNLIVCVAQITRNGIAFPNFSTFSLEQVPLINGQYKVSANKTYFTYALQIHVMVAATNSSSAIEEVGIQYADVAVGIDNSAVPSGAVTGAYPDLYFPSSNIGVYEFPLFYEIPSGKYPTFARRSLSTSATGIYMAKLYGYER